LPASPEQLGSGALQEQIYKRLFDPTSTEKGCLRMSNNTPVQWTDSTINPTKGCDGCELWNERERSCYAGVFTNRFGKSNPGLATDFDIVEMAPGCMIEAAGWSDRTGKSRPKKPWLNGLPRLVFVGDMADNLSESIPFVYLHEEIILSVSSEAGQRHHWQWLTKQPRRLAEFSEWLKSRSISWPANLWVGTSLTTQPTPLAFLGFLRSEAKIQFVSLPSNRSGGRSTSTASCRVSIGSSKAATPAPMTILSPWNGLTNFACNAASFACRTSSNSLEAVLPSMAKKFPVTAVTEVIGTSGPAGFAFVKCRFTWAGGGFGRWNSGGSNL
jgi:protein gp37